MGAPLNITGGCLCQAVRYTIAAEKPLGVRVCYCGVCRRLSAGGGTVNAMFRKDALTVSGETKDYSCVADSGSIMHRRFCPSCGTPMFSEAEPRPNIVIVRVGTFDNPELGKPGAAIWTGEAPSWACIDPDLPRFEAQPPPAG